MRTYWHWGRYELPEVSGLVTNWLTLQARRGELPRKGGGGGHVLVRLVDLERSLRRLPVHLREVVLLHGMAGWPMRDVGDKLCVSHQTIAHRYLAGLTWLLHDMNGDDPAQV